MAITTTADCHRATTRCGNRKGRAVSDPALELQELSIELLLKLLPA
jgi:hypothetical protein